MEKNKQTTSRASQTRSKTEKPKVWSPPNSLDAPPAPKGFRHQWIRAESMGYEDTKNVAASLREGYELVRADEYPDQDFPEIDRFYNHRDGLDRGNPDKYSPRKQSFEKN